MSNPHMNADKAYEADKQLKLDLIKNAYQQGRTDTLKAVREAITACYNPRSNPEHPDRLYNMGVNAALQALTKMEEN